MTRHRKRLAVLGGVLLVFAGAGVAFAAYLSSGSGTGATTSSVAVSSTIANPTGTIAPNGSGSYSLTATMAADPDNSCQGQSFTMPLTAQLASAAG